jgi:hypothetical protein
MCQNPRVPSRSKSMDGAGVDVGLRSFEMPEAGQILEERYDLVSWVGEGSFGEVWKAIDLRTGITVAVKLAKNSVADDRFAEEVKLLARLQHPGVVPLRDQWDASSPDARRFFVMDYCESNLKKWIAETTGAGGFDLETIRTLFLDVCRTVSFVHEQGTLHRDLKPSNILLLRDRDRFIPKLADFGEAGSVPEVDKTATEALGTACYQSPEQGLLGRVPSPASDVFALAVILYEMLTGQSTPDPVRPWWKIVAGAGISPASEDTSAYALEALRHDLSTRLPDAALRVLAQALYLDPEKRPSALDLGADFDRVIRERAATAGRPRSRAEAADRGGLSVIIPLSNAFGYLVAAGHPVLVDPKLTSRIGYGARTYPHAWLIAPLCAFVLVGTWLAFRYVDMRRRWWTALVPFLLAAAATIPILVPEVPHGALVADTSVWLAFTGMWLAAHYSFNTRDQASPKDYVVQSGRILFAGSLVAAGVAPIPIMLFLEHILEPIVTDPAESALLINWSHLHVGLWELLWLMGPTRELGIAWFRALRAAPPRR